MEGNKRGINDVINTKKEKCRKTGCYETSDEVNHLRIFLVQQIDIKLDHLVI